MREYFERYVLVLPARRKAIHLLLSTSGLLFIFIFIFIFNGELGNMEMRDEVESCKRWWYVVPWQRCDPQKVLLLYGIDAMGCEPWFSWFGF